MFTLFDTAMTLWHYDSIVPVVFAYYFGYYIIHLCDCDWNKNAMLRLNLKAACRINNWNQWIVKNKGPGFTISFCIGQMPIFPIYIHFWELITGTKCLTKQLDIGFQQASSCSNLKSISHLNDSFTYVMNRISKFSWLHSCQFCTHNFSSPDLTS